MKTRFFYGSNFFIDNKDNEKIINLIKELTFNYESLSNSLSSNDAYKKFYFKIKKNSENLLLAFGLKKNLKSANIVIENLINRI